MNDIYAPPDPTIQYGRTDSMQYASLWQRLGAKAIDLVIILLVVVVLGFSFRTSLTLVMVFVPIHGLSYYLYHVYLHGKCGQTVGKRLLKIKVVLTDGSPVGYVGAFRRQILMLLQSVPWVAASLIAFSRIPPDQYLPMQIHEMRMLELSLRPHWYDTAMLIVAALTVAEFASFMFTARRQSLSDRIGGTVVMKLEKES